MKLRLDDVRFPPDENWTEAKTPYEFIKLLGTQRNMITDISFDHDLACYVGPMEITGHDLLKITLAHYQEIDADGKASYPLLPNIHFHSANPVGSKNMTNLLKGILNKTTK